MPNILLPELGIDKEELVQCGFREPEYDFGKEAEDLADLKELGYKPELLGSRGRALHYGRPEPEGRDHDYVHFSDDSAEVEQIKGLLEALAVQKRYKRHDRPGGYLTVSGGNKDMSIYPTSKKDDIHAAWALIEAGTPKDEAWAQIEAAKSAEDSRAEQAEDAKHTLVTGYSGSGKSTLSRQLGADTGQPIVSVDSDPALKAWMVGKSWDDLHGKNWGSFQKERRQSLLRALSAKVPSIIEGTQIADDGSAGLRKGHNTILVDTPEHQVVRQRLHRDRKKGKHGPMLPGSAKARERSSVAKQLLAELSESVQAMRDDPGVEKRRAKKTAEDSRTATIIRGNPKWTDDNPEAAAMYAKLRQLLEAKGMTVNEDPGEAYTVPEPSDLWIGHSRGADRLRFAPEGTQTLAIGSTQPGAINHPDDELENYESGPTSAHYELTPEMLSAIKNAEDAKGIPDRKYYGDISKIDKDKLLDYVLQRHLARRAGPHFDLRIGDEEGMHSWATRKPLPTPGGGQTLLIRQPMHSHKYNTFEGTIPAGRYGAGRVSKVKGGKAKVDKATLRALKFTLQDEKRPEDFSMIQPDSPNFNEHQWLLRNITKLKEKK